MRLFPLAPILVLYGPLSCVPEKPDTGGPICYLDADADGFGDPDRELEGCDALSATNDLDCDDSDAAVNPDAEEACGDDIDDNCDGVNSCADIPDACGDGPWAAAVDASGTSGAGYVSVQDAIATAVSGDRICVLPGTYNEKIDFLGKDLEVIGVAGWDDTILDGTGLDSTVVTFSGGETRAALLQGFTVTGGAGQTIDGGTNVYGGGVAVIVASPTLRGLDINGNTAQYGGGVMIYSRSTADEDIARPLLENLVIRNNDVRSGNAGGGLASSGAEYTLQNAILTGNNSLRGGASSNLLAGQAMWSNVIVAGNNADIYGGGLYESTLSADHVLLCNNTAGSVGDGMIAETTVSFTNSVFLQLEELGYWSASPTVTYSRTTSFTGTGNVTDTPTYDCAALSGDLSAFWSDPDALADLGDPTSDADPDGSTTGMGAFSGPYGDDWDLDCDGVGSGPWADPPDADDLDDDVQ